MEEVLWRVTDEVRAARLGRFLVPLEEQGNFESEKLWRKVSEAIAKDDQFAATEEKSALEEAQRAEARVRKASGVEHVPKYFEMDANTGAYVYMHADGRPWDPMNDLYQYERGFAVCTKTKHKTPMVRTQSIVSVSDEAGGGGAGVPGHAADAGWAEQRGGGGPDREGLGCLRLS